MTAPNSRRTLSSEPVVSSPPAATRSCSASGGLPTLAFSRSPRAPLDADAANEVRQAADEAAAFGASLARKAGFRARGLTVEAAPTWKGILHVADEHHVGVIVLGSHRHTGLVGHLLGSVAGAVVSHANCPVLVVH